MSLSVSSHYLRATKDSVISSQSEIKPGSGVFVWGKVLGDFEGEDPKISNFSVMYSYGNDPSDRIEISIDDFEIESKMSCEGDSLITKLKLLFITTPDDEIDSIISSSRSPDNLSKFDKYLSLFLDGMIISTAVGIMMLEDNYSIGKPFGLLSPIIPSSTEIPYGFYEKNFYNYISYMTDMVLSIYSTYSDNPIGYILSKNTKEWWNNWGMCFVDGESIDISRSIYSANLAFAKKLSMIQDDVILTQNTLKSIATMAHKDVDKLFMSKMAKLSSKICSLQNVCEKLESEFCKKSIAISRSMAEGSANILEISSAEKCSMMSFCEDRKKDLCECTSSCISEIEDKCIGLSELSTAETEKIKRESDTAIKSMKEKMCIHSNILSANTEDMGKIIENGKAEISDVVRLSKVDASKLYSSILKRMEKHNEENDIQCAKFSSDFMSSMSDSSAKFIEEINKAKRSVQRDFIAKSREMSNMCSVFIETFENHKSSTCKELKIMDEKICTLFKENSSRSIISAISQLEERIHAIELNT